MHISCWYFLRTRKRSEASCWLRWYGIIDCISITHLNNFFFFLLFERVADVIAYRSTDAHVIEWIICEDLDPDVVQLWQWHRSIATFCDVATIALCLHIWHSITAYDKWKEEQHFHSFEIFIHAMTMLGNCFSSTIGKNRFGLRKYGMVCGWMPRWPITLREWCLYSR